MLLPLMGGMLVTSLVGGQLVSRTGRYKWMLVVGSLVMAAGLGLMSTMGLGTAGLTSSLFMVVLGVGMGFLMQTTNLVMQNSVEQRDLGAASGASTLFRTIGGSLGVSLLGVFYADSLTGSLTSQVGTTQAATLAGGQLTPATLGESSSVQVGQQVVAIGSPQGLTGTVTTGIVSAFNRTVSVQSESGGGGVVYNGLQTDAPINQGNSGGPLVNLDGQVIGINSAIATGSSQSTGSIGLGFAIPVDQAKRVAQEIIKSGSATKPVLGVTGSSGGQTAQGGGATITTVQPGSPAASAGLAAGDVVTKVGDAKVEDFSDLVARIGSYAPGQQVTLTVTSGGASKTVQVTLGSQPDKAASTGTGGENANPFGGGGGNGSGGNGSGGGNNPFGNLNPFGGGN